MQDSGKAVLGYVHKIQWIPLSVLIYGDLGLRVALQQFKNGMGLVSDITFMPFSYNGRGVGGSGVSLLGNGAAASTVKSK